MSNAVYEVITERIVSMLNEGVCPWRRPWNRMNAFPANFTTRKTYNGFNFFLLCTIGHEVPFYLTYRQATELGGNVRKGEQGLPITYWKLLKSEELDSKGEPKKIPLLRYYTVFNASQIEGVEFPKVANRTGSTFEPVTEAERIVSNWKHAPKIAHGYAQASYCPDTDTIQMPSPGSFDSSEAYYSTLFHELGHSTGHKSRLSRKIDNRFASDDYSREELVAEMTSAFLCAHCGIDNSTTPQSAAYLASWIKALKGDPRLAVTAAAQAQKAANLILCVEHMETDEEATPAQPEEVAA
jgi:antirestriction protein ArdC